MKTKWEKLLLLEANFLFVAATKFTFAYRLISLGYHNKLQNRKTNYKLKRKQNIFSVAKEDEVKTKVYMLPETGFTIFKLPIWFSLT